MNKAYVISSGAFVLFMASLILVNTFILSTHSQSEAYNNNMRIDFIGYAASDVKNLIYDAQEYEIEQIIVNNPTLTCTGGKPSMRTEISSGNQMRQGALDIIDYIAEQYSDFYGTTIEMDPTLIINVNVNTEGGTCNVDITHKSSFDIILPGFGTKTQTIESVRFQIDPYTNEITRVPLYP